MMANRFNIDANAGIFNLSYPGQDVFTAAPKDLLFTASAGGYHGVFTAGVVDTNATPFQYLPSQINPWNYNGQYVVDIMYPGGKIFPDIPEFFTAIHDPYTGGYTLRYYVQGIGTANVGGFTVTTGSYKDVIGFAMTDRFRFLLRSSVALYYPTAEPPTPRYLCYRVLEQ